MKGAKSNKKRGYHDRLPRNDQTQDDLTQDDLLRENLIKSLLKLSQRGNRSLRDKKPMHGGELIEEEGLQWGRLAVKICNLVPGEH